MCATNLGAPYLDVIVTVVVQVEDSVELRIGTDVDVLRVLDALRDRLARVLLHLDVVEFPAKKNNIPNRDS